MKYYIKQKLFSFKDKFSVRDEEERDVYFVEGKMFSLGNKLHITDMQGDEVLYIEEKLLRFLPEFDLYRGDQKAATVKKEFRFFKNDYAILGPDWTIEGSISAHDYVITERGRVIADINKKWFSWGDSYEINIQDEPHTDLLIGIVIAIDCVITAARNNRAN